MSRIAVLIENDFEDSEYSKPAEAFKAASNELIHVGLKKGETVKGEKNDTPVKIDESVQEISARQFDALFIPGGYSPDRLRAHEEAVSFVKDFMYSGKPVFAICHAPQLLITARVIEGRRATGWKSIVQDIKNAGGIYKDEPLVEDGNLITSRHPGDLPFFIEACLKKLTTPADMSFITEA
jgi:protease I